MRNENKLRISLWNNFFLSFADKITKQIVFEKVFEDNLYNRDSMIFEYFDSLDKPEQLGENTVSFVKST